MRRRDLSLPGRADLDAAIARVHRSADDGHVIAAADLLNVLGVR